MTMQDHAIRHNARGNKELCLVESATNRYGFELYDKKLDDEFDSIQQWFHGFVNDSIHVDDNNDPSGIDIVRSIHMSGWSLKDMEAILYGLATCSLSKQITEIHLADVTVPLPALRQLLLAIALEQGIEVLELCQVTLTGTQKEWEDFHFTLFKRSSLREFSFCHVALDLQTMDSSEHAGQDAWIKMDHDANSLIEQWFNTASSLPNVEILRIEPRLRPRTVPAFTMLAAICRKSSLLELHLGNLALGTSRLCMALIGRAVMSSQDNKGATLQALTLSACDIDDTTIEWIQAALELSSLRSLDLSYNMGMTAAACHDLTHVLQSHAYLKCMSFVGCVNIGQSGCNSLKGLLEINHRLEQLQVPKMYATSLSLVATVPKGVIFTNIHHNSWVVPAR